MEIIITIMGITDFSMYFRFWSYAIRPRNLIVSGSCLCMKLANVIYQRYEEFNKKHIEIKKKVCYYNTTLIRSLGRVLERRMIDD